MFEIGKYVIYKREVCRLVEIRHNNFNDNDYYVLMPLSDDTLKIEVPIANRCGNMRKLITRDEVEKIISEIPTIEVIENDNKIIENQYKELMNSGKTIDLIKIIKTSYLRNKQRIDNKKKTSDKDVTYFALAEKYLYQEFSIVLGKNYADTKQYVSDEVNKITNSSVI